MFPSRRTLSRLGADTGKPANPGQVGWGGKSSHRNTGIGEEVNTEHIIRNIYKH